MTPATTTLMTADQFCDWLGREDHDDRNYELVRVDVIEMPSPARPHGFYCWLVIKALTEYVTRRGSGHLLTNDTGILVEKNPDTLRGADVIVYLRDATPDDLKKKYVDDLPDLVVEVISPSDRPKDVHARINQYRARGVPLVWEIRPAERLVWVYPQTEFSKLLDETDELTGNGALPDFAVPVRALFGLPPTPDTASPA